jgi:hypothetical protein
MQARSMPIGSGGIGVEQEATAIARCLKAVQAVVRAALVWRSAAYVGLTELGASAGVSTLGRHWPPVITTMTSAGLGLRDK